MTERPSAFSGNKRPHNQLGLVPAKKMREQTRGDGMQLIQKEEKKVEGPRHMLRYCLEFKILRLLSSQIISNILTNFNFIGTQGPLIVHWLNKE